MEFIKKKLSDCDSVTLKFLFTECVSRYELIVLIMALLELCKANHVNVLQTTMFADIEISKGLKFFDDASTLQETEEST